MRGLIKSFARPFFLPSPPVLRGRRAGDERVLLGLEIANPTPLPKAPQPRPLSPEIPGRGEKKILFLGGICAIQVRRVGHVHWICRAGLYATDDHHATVSARPKFSNSPPTTTFLSGHPVHTFRVEGPPRPRTPFADKEAPSNDRRRGRYAEGCIPYSIAGTSEGRRLLRYSAAGWPLMVLRVAISPSTRRLRITMSSEQVSSSSGAMLIGDRSSQ